MENELYDFTIIGGGPTGLFGAFYAGLRQMKTKIIDSLPQLGGQLSALYPEKYIYDVAGFRKVLAKDLVSELSEQALQNNPTVCLEEKCITLEHIDGEIVITTNKATHRTKTVLIAGGVGAFAPRRLELAGITELEGKGVHYFVTDTERFRGRRIVIVGGGDSAFDWSLALGEIAASCIQIHRSATFRAHEDTVSKVQDGGNVDIRTFHELRGVHGTDCLEAVTVVDTQSGEETQIVCDDVILTLGFLSNLGPIKEWGLELQKNQIVVNSHMETNLPGVFAAGDICTYDGKLKLIVTGVAEAATAANFAKTTIDPTAKAFPGHSSDIK
jgi:thioredoxin reductase (NADPH)